jgi:hypothetical protein
MDFFIPPKMPIALPVPVKPISKTVTSGAASLYSTAAKDIPCIGVWLQSSSKDDSNAAMSGIIYVVKEETPGSGFTVLCAELVTGEQTWIPCASTAEIKVKTQTGTGWLRGYAVPVQPN